MSLPIRILVRTNIDWAAMTEEQFVAQQDPHRPINWIRATGQQGIFEHWNTAFDITFFEYRRRLQEIALQSARAAEPDVLTLGLDDFDDWFDDGDDELIVAMDDDDFVGVDVRTAADHVTDETNIVIWPHVHVGFIDGTNERTESWAPFRQLLPLNSAIRKSYLAENFDREDVKMMLAHHPIGNRIIAEQLGIAASDTKGTLTELDHPSVALIGSVHGLYNVHVGSIFFLQGILRSPDPVAALRALELTAPIELPVHIAAFEPYVRAFEAIW